MRISRLALHMYENVLLKSSSKGVIINTDQVADVLICKMPLIVSREMTETTGEEVCPAALYKIDENKKGIYCRKAMYPFSLIQTIR